jgi:hypothetical protein
MSGLPPKADKQGDISGCRLCAKTGRERMQQGARTSRTYSITSSANNSGSANTAAPQAHPHKSQVNRRLEENHDFRDQYARAQQGDRMRRVGIVMPYPKGDTDCGKSSQNWGGVTKETDKCMALAEVGTHANQTIPASERVRE